MTTITIVDKASLVDPGFTVTMGATPGVDAGISLYASAFTRTPGTWTLVGTRSGDGTIDVDLDPGYYFMYALTNSVEVTPIQYVKATDGQNAIHMQLMEAAQARIRGLLLTGISNDSIVVRKLPSDRASTDTRGRFPLPGIILSQVGIEVIKPYSNRRSSIDYPILVTILAADDQDLVTNQERYLLWRQTIRRSMTQTRFTSITGTQTAHYNCRVTPGSITAPREFWKNIYHSGMVIRCDVAEPHGI